MRREMKGNERGVDGLFIGAEMARFNGFKRRYSSPESLLLGGEVSGQGLKTTDVISDVTCAGPAWQWKKGGRDRVGLEWAGCWLLLLR